MAEPVTDGNDDADLHRQLAITDDATPLSHSISNSDSSITLLSPPFSLPHGWIIRQVPRTTGPRVDTLYYDPETGRQFRSLKSVERYLTGGFTVTPTKSKANSLSYHEKLQNCSKRKKIVSGGKMLDLEESKDNNQYQLVNVTPTRFQSLSPFQLPDGWIVEEIPRKPDGAHIDRYYYEPGTGQKFRSLASVQKYLTELEENSPLSVILEGLRESKLHLSKAFKLATPIKSYGSYVSRKKRVSKRDQDSSSTNPPPDKINWVISSTPRESWNAFVEDKLVPDSMKQQWRKRFMSAINNTKHDEQE